MRLKRLRRTIEASGDSGSRGDVDSRPFRSFDLLAKKSDYVLLFYLFIFLFFIFDRAHFSVSHQRAFFFPISFERLIKFEVRDN